MSSIRLSKNVTAKLCRLAVAILVVSCICAWIVYIQEVNRFAVNKNIDVSKYSLDGQILHIPSWIKDRSWGISKRKIDLTEDDFKIEGGAADKEEEYSWKTFFSDTANGLMLELGAVDGKMYSVSNFYERKAGWKSILIEASPEALKIPINRPNALSFQLAICQKESIIHFAHGQEVGGILEFMTPQFIRAFHSSLLKENLNPNEKRVVDMLDWNKVETAVQVAKQPCLPLQSVLDRFQITHINFMVLDLEGGELSTLKSLDFSRIHFDVMCVETNRFGNEKDPYIDEVVNFLTGKGYRLYQRLIGRNSWFVSPDWKKL